MTEKEIYLAGHCNRKYFCNFNFFEKIDTADKAYWLGFIAADGSISKNTLEIGVHKNDTSVLEKFKKSIESDHKIIITKTNMARLCITNKNTVLDLIDKGIIYSKTGKLNPNLIFSNIPDIFIRDFCRGFIDGDGSFACSSKKGSRITFKLGCKGFEFLDYFQDIIISKTNLPKTKLYKYKDREDYYCLMWGGTKQLKILYNFLYKNSDVSLSRKKEKIEAYFDFKEKTRFKRNVPKFDYSAFSYKNYSKFDNL